MPARGFQILHATENPRGTPKKDQPMGEGQFVVDDPELVTLNEAVRIFVSAIRVLDDRVEQQDPGRGRARRC